MTIQTAQKLMNKEISKEVIQKRMEMLDKSKKPKSKVPHVGIEIEFMAPAKSNSVKLVFAKLDLQEYVTLDTDGSIDVDAPDSKKYKEIHDKYLADYNKIGDLSYSFEAWVAEKVYPYEIKICVPESTAKRVINRVGDALKILGAYTNTSCGLHVHVDLRECTGRNAATTYANLYNIQDFIFSIVDPSRSDNDYCSHNPEKNFYSQLSMQVSDDCRYYAINTLSLEKYQTIEIRAFHGSVDAEEIYHFVQLVLSPAKAKIIDFPVTKAAHLKKIKKFPKTTVDYLAKKGGVRRRRAA